MTVSIQKLQQFCPELILSAKNTIQVTWEESSLQQELQWRGRDAKNLVDGPKYPTDQVYYHLCYTLPAKAGDCISASVASALEEKFKLPIKNGVIDGYMVSGFKFDEKNQAVLHISFSASFLAGLKSLQSATVSTSPAALFVVANKDVKEAPSIAQAASTVLFAKSM